jgi:hypothetical protein
MSAAYEGHYDIFEYLLPSITDEDEIRAAREYLAIKNTEQVE